MIPPSPKAEVGSNGRTSVMNRRNFLRATAAAGCGLAASHAAPATELRPFRFGFLTDVHIQPERGAVDGLKQCLASVQSLANRPQFAITGGDLIMDALDVGMERIQTQWRLFDECMKGLELPVHHTIGNHDVVGWSAKSVVKPGEQEYGKRIFAERYGEGRTYRSFDHMGWHFILLDSIGQNPATRDYKGWIDDEQLAWLQADLANLGRHTPIVIVTHIPFYSVWHQVLKGPQFHLDGKALVGNVFEFRKVFANRNVKLVLSGHGHIFERIELGGITYIQGGAVCGMWWKGPVFGNPEGFGVIECRPDGSFDFEYESFGWKARV